MHKLTVSMRFKLSEINRFRGIFVWVLGVKNTRILILISTLRSLLSLLDLLFLLLVSFFATTLSGSVNQTNRIPLFDIELDVNQVLIAILFTLILKNVGTLILQRFTLKTLAIREAEVGTYLAQQSIFQKEDDLSLANSSELMQNLSSVVLSLFNNCYKVVASFVAEITTLIAVLIGLFVFNWKLAIILFVFFSILGYSLSTYIGRVQRIVGEESQSVGKKLLQMYSEILALRVELKLSLKDNDFMASVYHERKKMAQIQSKGAFLQLLPRPLLELSLIIGLVIGILYVSAFGENQSLLAAIALLIAAGFRILPSLNAVIVGIGGFQNSVAALNRMDGLGLQLGIRKIRLAYDSVNKNSEPIPFNGDLVFKNVSYTYPTKTHSIFTDFNLVVRRNNTLLVRGVSGSGKTTLIALATGILSPQEGTILMKSHDSEIPIKRSISGISYLKQNVPLFDESFGYNIAMRPFNESDQLQLTKAAKNSGILNRILNSSESFNTRIGENGSLLSAGEKQRLGLARSLFTEPSLLILDEPTANLDSDSELLIWNLLNRLKGAMSILMVSHREVPREVYDDLIVLDMKE